MLYLNVIIHNYILQISSFDLMLRMSWTGFMRHTLHSGQPLVCVMMWCVCDVVQARMRMRRGRWLLCCRGGYSCLDTVNSSYTASWSSEPPRTYSNTTIRCVCSTHSDNSVIIQIRSVCPSI